MKDFDQLQVPFHASVQEAIAVIDREALQIVFVTDDKQCLIGTVTDGDVRRALLRGETLDSPVEQVMHREFRSLPASATEKEALALMRRESLHQIPVLDEQGRIIHLFLLEELIERKSLENPVIIMAGGEGKRLRPLTANSPKPMLRIGDKPILEIILEQCIEAGFSEFYLAVNYLKEQIQDYFEDGARWQVQIQYLEENKPLGTAGALSLIPQMPSQSFLVLNGDVLTRVDYSRLLRFHTEQSASATLCVREHTTQIPYGVVRLDDLRVLTLEEKPVLSHYVNAGIYLLNPELLSLVPNDQFFDMPQLLECAVQEEHRVSAFPIHEYWLDIGRPETLEQAHEDWQ